MGSAATMAMTALYFTTIKSTKLTSTFRTLPRFTCSSSSKFNISFSPSNPKPKPTPQPKTQTPHDDDDEGPLMIPWIVRGEDGNFKLLSEPPPSFLKEMANAQTGTKKSEKDQITKNKKKGEKETKIRAVTAPPKYSKAARRFYNENIKDDSGTRLSKVLAASGVASRRSCEDLIFKGKVTVNGSVCNTPQTKVDPSKDNIYVNGSRLPKRQPHKVYLALNKPKGYICSSGEKESKSVISLFDDFLSSWDKKHPGVPPPRLFTVGRLDVATTGLLIVTNDGDFAQKLSHPSSNFSKEYIATVDGLVHKRHLTAISEGTTIEGVHCVPDSVELLPRMPDTQRSRLRIVVHDGRKHEVRELVKSAGLEIHSLKRVRIGGFRLPPDLGIGKYIELNPTNLKALGGRVNKANS
ncbi:putative 23S rRNA pseudouridine(2605) synthase [Medicago truncatula]|uniref:Putative 23S rRNA pseudouridine(2605) synthase n=2 Tax=Medicago truncatula TaxID=3880 RepID=I3SRW6_MEDTR|nr:putative ribosomal large subunit pseudouridine synthase SVR1, chloroplastic isoform X1 [Medicago truncatula]AFK43008.1 unknown [Medicago truncatula]KEH43485.1 RNA pseudouridine synthase [Medicago truncatula]RHN81452.1 putative 23S rRNA pseudouridine(2605) synthase [Medicago truncatula]